MLHKVVLLPAAVLVVLAWKIAIVVAAPDSNMGFHREMAVSNVTRNADGDFFTITGTDCGPTRCMESSVGTALPAVAGPGRQGSPGSATDTQQSHGSGSSGSRSNCLCQCRADLPTFREDRMSCVDTLEECQMVKFGTSDPHIPFIFLPMKGQIIHPSKDIIFSDDKTAVCAVTGAQYLTKTGWTNLRDILDQDVPFALFRDEGKTFLKWRGSRELRARMQGRVVVAHVMCGARGVAGVGGALEVARRALTAPCAPFRVAGSPTDLVVDVSSVLFSAGETVNETPLPISAGLSLLETLAIAVSALILAFMYAAGLFFYLHVKKNAGKRSKDAEGSNQTGTSKDGSFPSGPDAARLEMENSLQNVKTNPLLGLESFATNVSSGDSNGCLSDVSEGPEDRQEASTKKPHIIAALVHSTRKNSNRLTGRPRPAPQLPALHTRGDPYTYTGPYGYTGTRRGGFDFERAPQSEVSIVDASGFGACEDPVGSLNSPCAAAGPVRRKLYFNPVFFETEHLKNPPPAAIEFLIKIREVMLIAKEKMLAKRFIPVLTRIPEEEFYHVLDLGWDMPYYPLSRRQSAISLKRENSRRSHQCTGCPGCAETKSLHEHRLNGIRRSSSCKNCASEDIKQKIVRKWLDDVPLSNSPNVDTLKMPQKSIAKVHGTPRSVEPNKTSKGDNKPKQISAPSPPITLPGLPIAKSQITMQSQINTQTVRKPRKKMPPPPPPPAQVNNVDIAKSIESPSRSEDELSVPVEIKEKMQAVIQELTQCRRIDPIIPKIVEVEPTEFAAPFIPPLIITVQPHFLPPPPEILYLCGEEYCQPEIHNQAFTRMSQQENYDADSLERCSSKRRFSLSYDDINPSTLEKLRMEPRRMSFVAMEELEPLKKIHEMNSRLSKSFRDVCSDRRPAWEKENIYENTKQPTSYVTCSTVTAKTVPKNLVSEVYVNNYASKNDHHSSTEFVNGHKDDENSQPGPLTIEVKGYPVLSTKSVQEDFDPDTLDRKPKLKAYNIEEKKRVDKILLKSAGSFKCKNDETQDSITVIPTESEFSRKVGSLREIYEQRNKVSKNEDSSNYTTVFDNDSTKEFDTDAYSSFTSYMKAPDLIQPGLQMSNDKIFESKPPLPPKQSRQSFNEFCEFSKHGYQIDGSRYENKDYSSSKHNGFYPRNGVQSPSQMYERVRSEDSFHARRMGRKSSRFRSKRNELKKFSKTEDSGYLSTDSNESRHRSRLLLQIRASNNASSSGSRNSKRDSGSDTEDFESPCDGMSESGAESIETNSVFFGNFRKPHPENMFKKFIEIDDNCNEVGNGGFETYLKQSVNPSSCLLDSGFQGETIIQSGDSDSEHRSVISIRTGRSSITSIEQLNDSYNQTLEC